MRRLLIYEDDITILRLVITRLQNKAMPDLNMGEREAMALRLESILSHTVYVDTPKEPKRNTGWGLLER